MVAWFASVVQWFNNLDVGWKIGIGLALFALACIITAITAGLSGGAAAIAPALFKVFLDFAVGVVSAFAFTAISMAITGDFSLETLGGAVADAIFWGGVFAFVSASVNAVKTVARTYAQGGKACDVVGQCFIAGTLVLCMDEDGNQCHKPIEEVKVGDMVWAYDEEISESDWKPVVQLFRNESKDWTGVTVNDLEIVSTPGHKYFLPETKKWVSAENLKVGAKVLLSDGSYAIIETVRSIHYEEAQTIYNFEVQGFHTYYVGNGVLVHNKGCGIGGHGWEGDSTWRANVKRVSQGGDILELKGGIPTQTQAEKLIQQAKGVLLRAENAHLPPNPHIFPHINYLTAHGKKGMIRLVSVIPKIY